LAGERPALEPGHAVAERLADGKEAVILDMALPFLHRGSFVGIAAEERRRRVDVLEIAADRDGLGDMPSVVEFQHRHGRERIDGEEFGFELVLLAQIDLLFRDFDAFFREVDADPPRIGRQREIVELHPVPPRLVLLVQEIYRVERS